MTGELSVDDSTEPRMYPSSFVPSYCPDLNVPSLRCGELFADPNCSIYISSPVLGIPVVFVCTYEAILVQQFIVGLGGQNRLLNSSWTG